MNLRDEMAKAGIRCEDSVVVDGKIHRFRVNGKRAKNGWYVFHERNGDVFGAFGDWGTGFQSTLGAKTEAIKQELRQIKDRGDKRAESAALKAEEMWEGALFTAVSNPYLRKKGVGAAGARELGDELLVPMYRRNRIVGLQRIRPDGTKRFTPGMKKLGSWFFIPGSGNVVVLCEGFATGATISMATRMPVLVAFDCGNLLPAARDYEAYVSDRGSVRWIVAADNDQKTAGNPGLTKAFEAAYELRGRIAVPIGTTGTDFNDLYIERGLAAVTELIYGCL